MYSYETQILVFLLVLGDSHKSTNTGVCVCVCVCYESHMKHKYKRSKIESLLIFVQVVYQWRIKVPIKPRGAWGPQTHRILTLVCFLGGGGTGFLFLIEVCIMDL
jgi:hypothetical protein